ncbi:CRISPR-associated protein Cas4, subtype PREFRAN [Leptospira inadai serovar Lyme str. 10]|uniref:CRISPR-associated protein Cas4, subtype PREFRAN n=2 Tax=Leptospira inadai serovar Lyme TaxID=293084 RepID=V6HI30_9LEPT|nr:CRISPR-associated protein Cas4, subtype PREFRAN [Leptospira inadai serovar Lyme str. 10]
MYHSKPQTEGLAAHRAIDTGSYTTRKDVLVGIDVYCEKYGIQGKIDIFDIKTGCLTERKNQIIRIYDGYIFQVYAQYFALEEMGLAVRQIRLHDITKNINHQIPLPSENQEMFDKFEKLIRDIKDFDLERSGFKANIEKCRKCIYSHLCDYSLC